MNDYYIMLIVAIICYTIYSIIAVRYKSCNRYAELNTLNELREKGAITQAEFDAKKIDILNKK